MKCNSDQSTKNSRESYVPGVCNIGPAEIKKRIRTGWFGLIITIALLIYFGWNEVEQGWRVAIFIPSMLAAMGLLQGYMRFCVYFGLAHLFNFGDAGQTDTVTQAEFRAKDRKKSWQIILYAALIGGGVTLFAWWV